jgi:hypothetical protein
MSPKHPREVIQMAMSTSNNEARRNQRLVAVPALGHIGASPCHEIFYFVARFTVKKSGENPERNRTRKHVGLILDGIYDGHRCEKETSFKLTRKAPLIDMPKLPPCALTYHQRTAWSIDDCTDAVGTYQL